MSLINEALRLLQTARSGTGTPVPYDELPISQGLCTLIADSVSSMDMIVVDMPPGRCHECTTGAHSPQVHRVDEVFPVIEQPDPDEDRADTLHKLVQSLYWVGNAFATRGDIGANGAVDSIRVVNPDEVGHRAHELDSLRVKKWHLNGVELDPDALAWWKINDNPRKGPMGRSVIQVCATALDTYGWAYSHLGNHFRNGGNPFAVFKTKLDLAPSKIEELSAEWVAGQQAGRPPFFPAYLDMDVPPTSGELAATLGVLEFATAEFARMLNVPVSLVNAPVAGYSLQYSNVGDEFRRWLAVSLGTTWLRRVERGFSALLPEGRWAKLDPSGLFPVELYPEPEARPTELAGPAPRQIGAGS